MALYNEILVGRFNNLIKKWMSFKGQAPAPQLAGEITPAFNIPMGVETRFLEGWYRYGWVTDLAATPGLTSAARLRNPEGSGMIAVIESCKLWSAAAQEIDIRQRANSSTNANLGTPSNPFSLEERTGPLPKNEITSSLQISTDLAGSQLGTAIWAMMMPAGGAPVELITYDDQQWVIDPGQWIQIFSNLANTRWMANFTWRERALEESERS